MKRIIWTNIIYLLLKSLITSFLEIKFLFSAKVFLFQRKTELKQRFHPFKRNTFLWVCIKFYTNFLFLCIFFFNSGQDETKEKKIIKLYK
jgi:hypothetical protein